MTDGGHAEGRACDVCGARGGRTVLQATDHRQGLGGWFRLVECRTCGLIRTEPRPDDLSRWYTDDYGPHAAAAPVSVRLAHRALARTARPGSDGPVARALAWIVPGAAVGGPLAAGTRVLDVGAGTGGAVAALREAGADAWGIEPSSVAVAVARSRGVARIAEGTLESADIDGTWDVIRFSHVLEHVPSPVQTLRRAASLLRPGGRIVVVVPNVDGAGRRVFGRAWNGLEVPRHLHHFSARTLQAAFAAADLRADSLRTVAQFGLLAGTLDAWTCGGVRQRGWGRSLGVRAGLFPLELALAALGLGEGLLAIATPLVPRSAAG